jgi:hypothetical protein
VATWASSHLLGVFAAFALALVGFFLGSLMSRTAPWQDCRDKQDEGPGPIQVAVILDLGRKHPATPDLLDPLVETLSSTAGVMQVISSAAESPTLTLQVKEARPRDLTKATFTRKYLCRKALQEKRLEWDEIVDEDTASFRKGLDHVVTREPGLTVWPAMDFASHFLSQPYDAAKKLLVLLTDREPVGQFCLDNRQIPNRTLGSKYRDGDVTWVCIPAGWWDEREVSGVTEQGISLDELMRTNERRRRELGLDRVAVVATDLAPGPEALKGFADPSCERDTMPRAIALAVDIAKGQPVTGYKC